MVNNCPISATITTRENNCHFLRVEKEDFNRIIKDCDASNVQLKEFDKVVLTLQKMPFNTKNEFYGDMTACYKYAMTSGTPERILEHLFETQISLNNCDTPDTLLEEFLMTHIIFLPTVMLCPLLIGFYNMFEINTNQQLLEIQPSAEEVLIRKRKVIRFIKEWCEVAKDAFYEDTNIGHLVNEIHTLVKTEAKLNLSLREEVRIIETIVENNPYKVDESVSKRVKGVYFLWF